MSISIESERPGDAELVRAVHLAAFPTSLEADLVEALHTDGDAVIALVARDGTAVVGHIMLSRMAVEGDGSFRALGLGPMAVLPGHQRQGIGRSLACEGLRLAQEHGEELVFVLGEPAYYRRFGFDPTTAQPFASPYAGPYFMAKAFGVDLPASGTAEYAPAFAKLS